MIRNTQKRTIIENHVPNQIKKATRLVIVKDAL